MIEARRPIHRATSLVGCVLALAAAAAAGSETIGFEELARGDRGYGLSVFAGAEVERFEVEVLGVLESFQPGMSFLLVRLSGQDLERSGVVAGMSGSPVYFEERLAGAVAFSWSFSEDPIAGVTPIADMQALRLPVGDGDGSGRGEALDGTGLEPPVELADLARADLPRDLVAKQLGSLFSPLPTGLLPAFVWNGSGLLGAARRLWPEGVAATAPTGASSSVDPVVLGPGSSIALSLISGDFNYAATGTVTHRDGDQIVAFGHPFLGLGPVDLPMASAEVVTVLSNRQSSFKVASIGPPVGRFLQDRRAGLYGEVGGRASTIPLSVSVAGTASRRFEMELAVVPLLTPSLVSVGTLGALEAATRTNGDQALDLSMAFDLGSWGRLELEQSFSGPNAAVDAVIYLFGFTSYLMMNPLAQVPMESIEVRLDQRDVPSDTVLVGGYAERTRVRPGESVRLFLELKPRHGAMEREEIEVQIPVDLGRGRYTLIVGDGVTMDAARLQVEPVAPVAFSQALRFLRSLHSRRELVVLGLEAESGLLVAGEVLPRLPGTAQSIWTAAASRSAMPLRLAIADRVVRSLDRPLSGAVRIDLEVERREPTRGENGGETGGGS